MITFNTLATSALFCYSGSVWRKRDHSTAWLLCKPWYESESTLVSSGAYYTFSNERVN